MHAEIIAIGTELTTGAKLDTNSQWLSQELSAVGIPVKFHTTVADDLDANIAVLQAAVDRADLVIITGGLGPTLDDLTRESLAAVMKTPLTLHEPSLIIIRDMFTRRQREMPARNVVQAMFPEGSEVILNPRGTAPGIFATISRAGRTHSRVFCMPGVPSEMKGMFQEFVLPKIVGPETQGRVIRHHRINVFGLGESACEELLGDVTARNRDPEVGITVHEATITMRIVAEGSSIAECEEKIAATRAVIQQRLGHYVFGVEDEELEHAVVWLLRDRRLTASTAESGTGGVVAQRLTNVLGHADCYLGGLIGTNAATLKALQGSAAEQLLPAGAVSGEAALQMAITCRERFASDYAMASTPCTTGDETNPPLMYVAIAGPNGAKFLELNLAGDPAILRSRAAKSLLNLLRLELR
jgi:nicotinamide-nucleotide amidase